MVRILVTSAVATAVCLAGCGFGVSSADLFVIQRLGQGPPLRAVVNDGGTVTCGPRGARPLSGPLLLAARDLADELDKDVKTGVKFPARPASVWHYRIALQDGTLAFADTTAAAHPELARAELLAAQLAAGPCANP